LIDFLQEALFFTVNGRVTIENDGYTSRGSSVVHYILVSHEQINVCKSFQVLPCTKLIDEYNLRHLLGNYCKVPDHSMLVLDVCFPSGKDLVANKQTIAPKRFRLNHIPDTFLNNDVASQAMGAVIDQIQANTEQQSDIDNIYEKLCNTIWDEMNRVIPVIGGTKQTRKKCKVSRPFWDKVLGDNWKKMRDKEEAFRKCKVRKRRDRLWKEFKEARHCFDKMFRQKERKYMRGRMIQIEDECTSDPHAFWNMLKNLGPKKKGCNTFRSLC
jgi:hypothetical protein